MIDLDLSFNQSSLFTNNFEIFDDGTEDKRDDATKEVKLINGNTIKLKKRPPSRYDIETDSHVGTFDDTSNLFAKAELINSLQNRKTSRSSTSKDDQLWTEKYRPSKFIQLCSAGNDRQYRLVLHWLKRWSSLVFGDSKAVDEGSMDPLGRFHRNKILLIHGPVGIGKTVAADVIARQLGYHVEELHSASNLDNMANESHVYQALKLKITNALTSDSITAKGRPTCLVIDEIDTNPHSNDIVRILNDLVLADRGERKKKFKLNRPIICIANDIYGRNGMEKLRKIADIIAFRKPSTVTSNGKGPGTALRSIKEHLGSINKLEKLGLDYQEVGNIVEACDGDIRACLNYLQFNGRKIETTSLSSKDVKGPIARKDSQPTWFALAETLLKRNAYVTKEQDFESLLDYMMSGSGLSVAGNTLAFEKVVRNVFNRYLDVVHMSDDSLKRPGEFSDWLNFYDSMSGGFVNEEYLSLVGLKIWSLFGEINPGKNKDMESLIPNAKSLDFDSFEQLKQTKSIMKRVVENLPPGARHVLAGAGTENISSEFACHVFPQLSKILVSDGVEKANAADGPGKNIVVKTAALVNDIGITLESFKDLETNRPVLQFSPNIDVINAYHTDFAPVSHRISDKQTQLKRQWLFPLIKAELERLHMRPTKRLRESERADSDAGGSGREDPEKKKSRLSSSIEFFKLQYDDIANHLDEPKTTTKSKIWVKYNEGFSNAVKKNIGWAELWS